MACAAIESSIGCSPMYRPYPIKHKYKHMCAVTLNEWVSWCNLAQADQQPFSSWLGISHDENSSWYTGQINNLTHHTSSTHCTSHTAQCLLMAQTPADTYRQDKTLRLAKHILHPTPCEWGSCKAILNSLHALEKVCNNEYFITAISLGPAFLLYQSCWYQSSCMSSCHYRFNVCSWEHTLNL